MPETTGIHC